MRIIFLTLTILALSSTASAFSSQAALQASTILTAPKATTPEFSVARDFVFGGLEQGYAGRSISTRLLLWSLPWMGAAILGLTLTTDETAKGFWSMSGAWAFINGAIAMIGLLTPEPSLDTLRTTLLINSGIDVLYIAGGIYMLTRAEPYWRGAGVGVIIQGAFLLIFDLWQGLTIRF